MGANLIPPTNTLVNFRDPQAENPPGVSDYFWAIDLFA
jgi:hypothetical protein